MWFAASCWERRAGQAGVAHGNAGVTPIDRAQEVRDRLGVRVSERRDDLIVQVLALDRREGDRREVRRRIVEGVVDDDRLEVLIMVSRDAGSRPEDNDTRRANVDWLVVRIHH